MKHEGGEFHIMSPPNHSNPCRTFVGPAQGRLMRHDLRRYTMGLASKRLSAHLRQHGMGQRLQPVNIVQIEPLHHHPIDAGLRQLA